MKLKTALTHFTLSLTAFAALAESTPTTSLNSKNNLAVVFASDSSPNQPSIDFYKSVYQVLSKNQNWEVLTFSQMRKALAKSDDSKLLGGIPTIDRESFRKKLPKKKSSSQGKLDSKTIPGAPVAELQRLLDNLRAPAAIIVDCAKRSPTILKGCGLYYYNRTSARVTASVVKTFVAGATDATAWAEPMCRTLEEGISGAERQKDMAIIEELVARQEQDEDKSIYGTISIFGRGDRVHLSNQWHQTIAGGGLQIGVLSDNVGAYIEYAMLTWSGDSEVKKAKRTNYGIDMMFRSHALDSLLWFLEIGGGKEESRFSGENSEDFLASEGIYANFTPGVGVELSDYLSLNLGINWRWYFENSSNTNGKFTSLNMENTNIPAVLLRATVLM